MQTPRNKRQSKKAAKGFAERLRVLDTKEKFSVFHEGQEVVVLRESSGKRAAIIDIFEFVSRQIAKDVTLEDIHMHFDGDSLSMYFTETEAR